MTTAQDAKAIARAYWAACDAGDTTALASLLGSKLRWDGPWPVKEAGTAEEIIDRWAAPLRSAVTGLDRQFHVLMAGISNGRADGGGDGRLWAAGTGYLTGTHVSDVFGVPGKGRPVRLRWGEFLCIDEGRISEVQLIVDVVDWLEQVGCPVLPPSNGVPFVWPAATGYDAVLLGDADAGATAETLSFGRDFIFGGLNGFDQDGLESMGMADYFHPNVKWYGPAGIGACLSFAEFEDRHQRVWLEAFPDRKVQDLTSLFAEGPMLAASGTAGVIAHQTGPYLGVLPSGNRLEISGIDFWLRKGRVFTENWVFVDMIKLFAQMGVDLFDRVEA